MNISELMKQSLHASREEFNTDGSMKQVADSFDNEMTLIEINSETSQLKDELTTLQLSSEALTKLQSVNIPAANPFLVIAVECLGATDAVAARIDAVTKRLAELT